ncbi:MAG: hypothetical protein WB117_06840, partial [Candidatus Acidiferrales bacterium]
MATSQFTFALDSISTYPYNAKDATGDTTKRIGALPNVKSIRHSRHREMSDLYDKVRDDPKFRLAEAENIGVGFK